MPDKPKRRNATKLLPLDQIDSKRERLPADRVKLSSKERALLKDSHRGMQSRPNRSQPEA
jgi:hypothetical protein